MTIKEIQTFRSRVEKFIENRRLRDAIHEISETAHRNSAWNIIDRINHAEESYAYMLRYVADGVEDPERNKVYDQIVEELYSLLDSLVNQLLKAESPSLYYSTLRTAEAAKDKKGIAELFDEFAKVYDKMSIFSILASGESHSEEESNQRRLEELQSDLFLAIWTKSHLSSSEEEAISEAIFGDVYPWEVKVHIISAVMLGLFAMFDARKMEILMSAYMNNADMKVSSAALIGLLFGLWLYRNRPLPVKLRNQLASLKELPSWSSDLRIAFIEMIRTYDTERISNKIQNEVLPDMINLRPEIIEKINGGTLNLKDASLYENPEWEELLNKNGIADKLKELTEMQIEGGDVMMSTFAHLKTFPFFNSISNWFLPFNVNNSQVASSVKRIGIMAELINNAMFLCDSDKYSFMFAINMVDENQRKLMESQFKAQSDGIYQAINDAQNGTLPDARKRAVRAYLQNIYRFFKLYRRRDEFLDPFKVAINLITVPSLIEDFDDPELLQVVAEFYFKLGYMRNALDVYRQLEQHEAGNAQRYQKMGYCAERMGDKEEAIRYYQMAELLDSGSQWTCRRMAACYRAIGNKDMALKYYRQLSNDNPEDVSIALLYGYALTEKGDYAEAVNQFYKVEFLDEESTKSWRPLAWTLFLTGDFEASKRYFNKIAADNPKSVDYLNMGHVNLASGEIREAINNYILSIRKGDGNRDTFLQLMAEDAHHLESVGVNKGIIPLIADAVFYSLDK